jgi:hypothetical protein
MQLGLELGEMLKITGMRRAAKKRLTVLETARLAARAIALLRDGMGVTADDVSDWLEINGHPKLGNAAGSLFRDGSWVFTGKWRKSPRATNHARENRVWRLK